jgi:hypothetical protein
MIIEAKKQIPEKKSEWVFVRRNSKGENIFRRDTHQTAEYVADVLNEKEIPFVYSEAGSCFRIHNEAEGRNYQYYPTTGRWGVYFYQKRPTKHYHSKSIEDFLDRFFFKTSENSDMKDTVETKWNELVRKDGSDTSVEAAKTVDAGKLEKKVYEVIKTFPNGCIQDDVLNVLKDLPYSSVTARFAALKRKGLIEKTEEKRVGLSGSKQSVLKVKQE